MTHRVFALRPAFIFAAWFVAVAAQAMVALGEESSPFSSTTIDLGLVVSDVEKSLKFYKDAIGFKEIEGFYVPADYAKDVGLTDGHRLDIHVLVLGDEPGATKLKIMSLPNVESRRQDQRFIHSTLGFSYISVHVKDTDAALERLKKAGVKPIAKGSLELPENLPQGVFLTLVRDPDGNFVELIGPKAKK